MRNLAYSCAKLGRVVWFYSRMNCNVSVSDQERSGCKFQVSFFFFFLNQDYVVLRMCTLAFMSKYDGERENQLKVENPYILLRFRSFFF